MSLGRTNSEDDVVAFVSFIRNYFTTRVSQQTDWHRSGRSLHVSSIHVYPIKSCGGVRVQSSWPLSPSGFLYDRFFALVDEEGVALDQKRHPKMCLISPRIDLDTHEMTVTVNGDRARETLRINLRTGLSDGNSGTFTICDRSMGGVACANSSIVKQWFSRVIGVPCRLVRTLNENKSKSFANRGQILAISQASVDWLRIQLGEHGNAVDETSFRANIVVAGECRSGPLNSQRNF